MKCEHLEALKLAFVVLFACLTFTFICLSDFHVNSMLLKCLFADVALNTIFQEFIFLRKQMSVIIFFDLETDQSQIGNHPIRQGIIIRRKVIII